MHRWPYSVAAEPRLNDSGFLSVDFRAALSFATASAPCAKFPRYQALPPKPRMSSTKAHLTTNISMPDEHYFLQKTRYCPALIKFVWVSLDRTPICTNNTLNAHLNANHSHLYSRKRALAINCPDGRQMLVKLRRTIQGTDRSQVKH